MLIYLTNNLLIVSQDQHQLCQDEVAKIMSIWIT